MTTGTYGYDPEDYGIGGGDDGGDDKVKDKKFIDRRRVVVTAGNGGSGAVSFMKDGGSRGRRGADGGHGGMGGSVYVQSLSSVKGLGSIPFRVAATNGGRGAKQGSNGRRGEDVELKVPLGTVVWQEIEGDDGDEIVSVGGGSGIDFSKWGSEDPVWDGEVDDDENTTTTKALVDPNRGTRPRGIHEGKWKVLADMDEHKKRILLAKGGRGGKGNRAKPRGELAGTADKGADGGKLTVVLELKSVADLGLVGLPNAGKSTLLRAISDARPNVADYAFTTMSPQLGAVKLDGGLSSVTVADIPGLIKGAHENRGLGHNFLRHVERCAAFLFVVDLSSGMGDRPGMRPWEALKVLRAELDAYLPGLSNRPAIVVGTKTDVARTSKAAEALRRRTDLPVVCVSANASEGIDALLSATEDLLERAKRERDEGEARDVVDVEL